jgi:hypothetical protein
MSVVRKIVVSTAALILALTGAFLTTGTAGADCDWNRQCERAN